jgi:hypothetical protein
MNKQHFKRSKLIFNMLSALAGLEHGSNAYKEKLLKIPTYFSRGKSGKSANKTGHAHMASVRKSRVAHNVSKRK